VDGSGRALTSNGGTRKSGAEVILSDGSSFFVPASVWATLARAEGAVAEDAWISQIQGSSEALQIRDRALGFLATREHSRVQLSRKLAKRGFDARVVDAVLDDLAAARLVDDARYARTWIESRLRRHPEGRAALSAGLARAGVSREIADRCLSELLDENSAILEDAVAAAAEKIQRSRVLDPSDLRRKLAARGFAYGLIRKYLERRGDSDL
jgi:regulatory protein